MRLLALLLLLATPPVAPTPSCELRALWAALHPVEATEAGIAPADDAVVADLPALREAGRRITRLRFEDAREVRLAAVLQLELERLPAALLHTDQGGPLDALSSEAEGMAAPVAPERSARHLARIDALPLDAWRIAAAFDDDLSHARPPACNVLDGYLESLDSLAPKEGEQSPLLPRADAVSPAVRAGMAASLKAKGLPALRRLAAHLRQKVRPACRAVPGLAALPGGREAYVALLQLRLGTSLTPEQLAARGAEVAKASTEAMAQGEALSKSTEGTPMKSEAEVQAAFESAWRRVPASLVAPAEAAVPRFAFQPSWRRGNGSAAEFTAEAEGPGLVEVDPTGFVGRPAWSVEVLAFHEGTPGHALQGRLARSALRDWRVRAIESDALVEGWALFAESLAVERGLASHPGVAQSLLRSRRFRAARLVSDTGLHALGWSRAEAIRTFSALSGMPERGAAGEIDRESAIPGQALGYLVGAEAIAAMREQGMRQPGFEEGRFLRALLEAGPLPLDLVAPARLP